MRVRHDRRMGRLRRGSLGVKVAQILSQGHSISGVRIPQILPSIASEKKSQVRGIVLCLLRPGTELLFARTEPGDARKRGQPRTTSVRRACRLGQPMTALNSRY